MSTSWEQGEIPRGQRSYLAVRSCWKKTEHVSGRVLVIECRLGSHSTGSRHKGWKHPTLLWHVRIATTVRWNGMFAKFSVWITHRLRHNQKLLYTMEISQYLHICWNDRVTFEKAVRIIWINELCRKSRDKNSDDTQRTHPSHCRDRWWCLKLSRRLYSLKTKNSFHPKVLTDRWQRGTATRITLMLGKPYTSHAWRWLQYCNK